MLLLFTSFIAGVLTVLAPCTIALLPVIVGGTLAGGRSMTRALTVTISLGISVLVFTYLLKVGTLFVNVPQSFWEILSGAIIALIGFLMLFPYLWDGVAFFGKVNQSGNRVIGQGYVRQNFWGDVLVGSALGPVFSSCSPTYFLIIATILPVSLAQGALDLLAYTFGLCATLLVVAVAGQNLLSYFDIASNARGWLRRSIGALFLLIGLAIAFGLEQKFELAFAGTSGIDLSAIEQRLLSSSHPAPSANASAPDITNPAGFINTNGAPVSIGQYKNKAVVLIDFWDYSCINCEREIPYVEAWYEKYKDEGLVVIGVHTPEFSFEKLQSNVAAAVASLGITYPVVLDNDYATWNAFHNEYWPQIYLIGIDGSIVYSHSGEGNYPETEAAIQNALAARATQLGLSSSIATGSVAPKGAIEADGSQLGSPETYFGSDRNEYLANGARGYAGVQTLELPSATVPNGLYLGGVWHFYPEYAEAANSGAAVSYTFDAKNVYLVATGNPKAKVEVLLDGTPISASEAGADVAADSTMTIDADRLYKVVSLPSYGTHTLELRLVNGTLDAYTFTFG